MLGVRILLSLIMALVMSFGACRLAPEDSKAETVAGGVIMCLVPAICYNAFVLIWTL